ncbi:MAG: peptide ABC transporter permease [Micrococcales bacterium 70-64]|nr:ABC transporter permease [Leifsonia sp.]ODU63212.1 MAG: peptide ABC transporter permease [Leifsonia sp. SCN 70-46]OJX84903.1 MAG: peptide ABC transporter permease [Micrococcales bacterium 70-64]
MLGIILRRLVNLVIILFVVGTLLFFLIRAIPGDPAVALLGSTAKPEELEALRQDLGLSGPLYLQYLGWFGRVLQGDFGMSIIYDKPVLQVIADHIAPTLTIAIISTALSFLIAVLITVWNSASPRNPIARALNQVSQIGLALPDFWLAVLLVYLIALNLRWLPTSGYTDIWVDPVASLRTLVLPIAVLVIGQAASYVIVLREGMLGQMSQLYLRTARVKGLSEFSVALRHALPNALLPILTIVGLNFAGLVGGIVILENIFVIPGLGSMMLGAINSRDFLLLQGGALFVAFLFVVVNLITDLTYALVDPKVRVS